VMWRGGSGRVASYIPVTETRQPVGYSDCHEDTEASFDREARGVAPRGGIVVARLPPRPFCVGLMGRISMVGGALARRLRAGDRQTSAVQSRSPVRDHDVDIQNGCRLFHPGG